FAEGVVASALLPGSENNFARRRGTHQPHAQTEHGDGKPDQDDPEFRPPFLLRKAKGGKDGRARGAVPPWGARHIAVLRHNLLLVHDYGEARQIDLQTPCQILSEGEETTALVATEGGA